LDELPKIETHLFGKGWGKELSEVYNPFHNHHFPERPMIYHTTTLKAFDGTPIFLRRWLPEDQAPRAVLIIVHGLAEHAARYKYVVDTFLPQGYVIYGHDHRGFGKSGGIRGHWEHFDDVIRDMEMVVNRAKREWPDLPFGMFAHSMGGIIGIHYLSHHEDQFRAAVISAPGFGPGPSQNRLLLMITPIAAKIIPRKPLDRGEPETYTLSHDPDQAAAWADDPLVHPYSTPRWAVEYLRAAREAKSLLAQLSLPVLVVMGSEDVTIDREDIREAVAAAGPNVTFREYPGAYHEVHNEVPEIREVMLAETLAWMDEKLADAEA
jgi:alpha-beta hydrolase superfamily lysophospholipase